MFPPTKSSASALIFPTSVGIEPAAKTVGSTVKTNRKHTRGIYGQDEWHHKFSKRMGVIRSWYIFCGNRYVLHASLSAEFVVVGVELREGMEIAELLRD